MSHFSDDNEVSTVTPLRRVSSQFEGLDLLRDPTLPRYGTDLITIIMSFAGSSKDSN
jgi:hypothetical protein